jgi:hypothetical protein
MATCALSGDPCAVRALITPALLMALAACSSEATNAVKSDAAAGGADAGSSDARAFDVGASDALAQDAAAADAAVQDGASQDAAAEDASAQDAAAQDAAAHDAAAQDAIVFADAAVLDAAAPDALALDAAVPDASAMDASTMLDFTVIITESNTCDITTNPASISVPAGTSFTVNWVNSAASASNVDVAKIDMFNQVPIVLGLEPGNSYHDTVRAWCGALFMGMFQFRITGCAMPYYLNVNCSG